MPTDLHELARDMRRRVIDASYRAHMGHIGSALCIVGDPRGAVRRASLRRRRGPRPLHPLQGPRRARAVRGARGDRARSPPSELETLLRGRDARSAPIPSTSSTGSTSRPARSARASRSAPAPPWPPGSRARRGASSSLISDAELQRGIRLGGGDVRRPPSPRRTSPRSIDLNGQQALGYTRDVLDLDPRRRAVARVRLGRRRGRRARSRRARATRSAPTRRSWTAALVIAQTTFGKGVSFMESRIEWHYLPLSDEQYARGARGARLERPAVSEPHESGVRRRARRASPRGPAGRAADRRPRLRGARAVRRASSPTGSSTSASPSRTCSGSPPAWPTPASSRSSTRSRRSPPCGRYEFLRNGAAAPRAAGARRRRWGRARLRAQRRHPLRARGRRAHARPAADDGDRPGRRRPGAGGARMRRSEYPGPVYIRLCKERRARRRPRRALRARARRR